ncbi:MAG: hypothetical protein NVSMB45_06220 [Ginsengibacter sp.]
MKKLKVWRLPLLLFIILLGTVQMKAQKLYKADDLTLSLKGTSNLHNWEMKATHCVSKLELGMNTDQKIISISKMDFILPVKNLKSEWKAMDKNTYKALKTDISPNIDFTLISAKVTSTGLNSYSISSVGNMLIAGVSKETELTSKVVYDPINKSLSISGTKKIKMTDYNIQPPKALLGTIKTGDDVSITYEIKFI